MFNNSALDVAIGLTFIFVLYSLLALAVNEFLATIFAYRHRMLERALEQMLDGKNYGYYWWDKVLNFFLWIYYRIKEKNSGQQNEEIKYLDDFLSKTNLSNPKVATSGRTDKFYYRRIKINDKAELFTVNFTDHPLYKRKSERSLFFKKPAYLSADSFADILIDVLGQNRIAGNPILLRDITAFVNTQINNNPDLKKVLNLYIEQANGDLQQFKFLLENWFDDTMERVTGWYKKQSYRRSIIIGFLIAMTFNVNTIHVVKKLSKDKIARAALVQNATEFVKTHVIDTSKNRIIRVPSSPKAQAPAGPVADTTKAQKDTSGYAKESVDKLKDSLNKLQDSIKNLKAVVNNPKDIPGKVKDSSIKQRDTISFEDIKASLREIDSLYKYTIAENDSLLGLGWGNYGYDSILIKKKEKYSKDSLAYVKGERKKMPKKPGESRPVAGKVFHVLGKTLSSPYLFFGFLITAFAISLGAPFWFDLLNRFVNLRVSGAKPAEANNPVVTKTTRLSKKPDPTAKG